MKYLNIENNNIDALHNLINTNLAEIRAMGNPIKEIYFLDPSQAIQKIQILKVHIY